jgi:hypothetical protein
MSKEAKRRSSEEEQPAGREHLDDIAGGCGCVEVWENLSEYRQGSD